MICRFCTGETPVPLALVDFFRKTADGFYPLTAICFFYGKLKTENGVFTMPKCTVCHHPQLLEINQAILSKDFTLAVLSRKYGLHPSSLQRHKNHLEIKMSRSLRRLREIREQGSLLVLNDLLEKVRRHIAAADAEGNYLAVFRGSHVASRLIHQMGRVEGDMQPDTLHRLISSPAWVPGAGLLPTDPSLITGLHQGLVDGAAVPCPVPPLEISAHAAGEADD